MNLDQAETKIKKFFDRFSDTMNRALRSPSQNEVNSIVNAYATCFVEAGPDEVICSVNDKTFHASTRKGLEFRRSIGARDMKISSLKVEPIGGHHFLAKVRWRSRFVKPEAREVEVDFDVTYLLHMDIDDNFKIFCHVIGNELETLNENGLLPNQSLPEDFYVF